MMFRLLFLLLWLTPIQNLSAQQPRPKVHGWHLLDPQADGYRGISLPQAYQLLKGRQSTTVIVAVIDSGIDTAHQDLQPILWRNEREIAGNGKDDDGNGYVDDVYGWNFCGAPDGTNLARNSQEIARVYHNWKNSYEGKKEKEIPADQRYLFSQWQRAASLIEKDYKEGMSGKEWIGNLYNAMETSSAVLEKEAKLTAFTAEELKPLITHSNPDVRQATTLWRDLFSRVTNPSVKSTDLIAEIKTYRDGLENKIARKLTPPEDFRGALVKNRYTDLTDRFYGNNNLKTGSGDHGTLVAGVIGAVRNNGIGIDGIADNVRIMALRAVPGGDEHDKDVALAIRYAVDNGAKVINMSFGKPVSPYKQFVDEAVKYAEEKGVLLVHAAGNEGQNLDLDPFYPRPLFIDGRRATNYLTVGASGDESTGAIAAPFSNYSAKWVDVFSPGMHIYSTATDNRYTAGDGTSLASPVVAGIAALLRSYFPKLTPQQLITILTTTGRPVEGAVTLPGSSKSATFSSLSSSGRIVNAYEAVKRALEMEKQ